MNLATLYAADSLNTRLFLALNHLHHPLLDPLMTAMIYLGSSKMVFFYAAALGAYARVRPQKMSLGYPLVYLAAALLGAVLQAGLKEFFEVPRPAAALGLEDVRILGALPRSYTFPSGHAVFGGVTAATLGWRRGWRWKGAVWLFAILVAWSRVYVGVHYPLDVIAGLGIGAAIGWIVWVWGEHLTQRYQ